MNLDARPYSQKILNSPEKAKQERLKRTSCRDCGNWAQWYMVTREVWREAVPYRTHEQSRALFKARCVAVLGEDRGPSTWSPEDRAAMRAAARPFLLCLGCLERRLGRALVIQDFTDVPCNDALRAGYLLGCRAPGRPSGESLKALGGLADQVRRAADEDDDEGAHSAEDQLMVAALEAILRGEGSPAEIAAVALSTRDLDFARWCA